ncbi:MAG TPA: transporter associated domain-containing protein [Sulfuricaulis sp.]|nr:transporter associated domain-containing protein [Sulfuricaulis sp.]
MNDKNEDKPGATGDTTAAPRSLLDRLSHALLGEPATRNDLIDVLRDSAKRDLLDRDSLDMIEGVLQVSEMKVRDIMVPRSQMDVVDKNQKPEEYLPLLIESGHSRFPMVDGDKDKVIGILLAKDLLRYLFLDKKKRAQFNVHDMLRPAVFVPESKRLNVLLREFRTSRNHMAIVVDEYGGVAGLVTIEDVLEQIVGEIADEYDIEDDVMIMPRDGGEYVVKALVTLADFNTRLNSQLVHEEIDTVGGLVMNRLGHVPRRGEKIDIDNWRFEVLRADSRRVYLLKVTPVEQPDRQKAK